MPPAEEAARVAALLSFEGLQRRRDGLQRRVDKEASPAKRATLQRLLDGASSILGGGGDGDDSGCDDDGRGGGGDGRGGGYDEHAVGHRGAAPSCDSAPTPKRSPHRAAALQACALYLDAHCSEPRPTHCTHAAVTLTQLVPTAAGIHWPYERPYARPYEARLFRNGKVSRTYGGHSELPTCYSRRPTLRLTTDCNAAARLTVPRRQGEQDVQTTSLPNRRTTSLPTTYCPAAARS